MATKTSTTTTNDGTGKKLAEQPRRFVGLFLTPLAGLLVSWIINAYVRGISVDFFGWHWRAPGSTTALVVTSCLLTLGAVGLGAAGWAFAEHRKPTFRRALAGSSFAIGALFAVSTGVGPDWWWSFVFVLVGWYAATLWSLARLHVTRQDPRESGSEEKEGVWEKMGLKGFRPKVAARVYDKDGNLERTEIDVDHPGETTEPLHGAVRNMESLAGAPSGLSHAVGTDRADRSKVVLLHKDPLKGRFPYGPPSHPGGSIADPIIFSVYKDGMPVRIYLGGGPVSINPTGYIFMGMSRSGKTLGENEMLTEVISRRDAVILYLNRAKGRQDIRPIAPGVAVAVLSDSDADYRSAFQRVKKLMTHRSKVLGEYGISAWSPKCYSHPPQRKANGDPVPMEPLPALIVHTGEADDVLEAADDAVVYVASKGLSLGVISGYSLQRALTDSMPSALKENLGLRLCFGTGNWNAASFVMDEDTLKSVDPSQWGAKFPGRHLLQGPGIDEDRQPVYAKTMSLAPGMDEDASIDEHNAAMSAEMLRRNYEHAPKMAALDRGSALATGSVGGQCWWDLMVGETAKLRSSLGVGTANDTAILAASSTASSGSATPANMTASDRPRTATSPQPYPTANQEDDVRFQTTAIPDDADDAETAEVRAEMDDLTEYDGLPLFPPDEDGETAESLNLDDPLPRAPEGSALSWEDPLPAPASRGEAIAAVKHVLGQLVDDPSLADPDGQGALVTVAIVREPYPFKSRPWFSDTLSAMATGEIDLSQDGLSLTVAEEFPVHDRRFRLQRVINNQ